MKPKTLSIEKITKYAFFGDKMTEPVKYRDITIQPADNGVAVTEWIDVIDESRKLVFSHKFQFMKYMHDLYDAILDSQTLPDAVNPAAEPADNVVQLFDTPETIAKKMLSVGLVDLLALGSDSDGNIHFGSTITDPKLGNWYCDLLKADIMKSQNK